MTGREDRMVILKLIEEGRITADEGTRLLNAMGGDVAPQRGLSEPPVIGDRWLRVTVTDTTSGRLRTNVRVPVRLAHTVLRLAERFVPHEHLADIDDVLEVLRAGEVGKAVDVLDAEGGTRVEVFVE